MKEREEAVAHVAFNASDVVYSIVSSSSSPRNRDTSATFAPMFESELVDRGNDLKVCRVKQA